MSVHQKIHEKPEGLPEYNSVSFDRWVPMLGRNLLLSSSALKTETLCSPNLVFLDLWGVKTRRVNGAFPRRLNYTFLTLKT